MAGRATLVVPGEPMPLERARYSSRNRRWYLPKRSQEFRERVRTGWLVEGRPRLDGPLVVSAEFVLARKRSHLKVDGTPRKGAREWPPEDVDNLLKAILDALQDDRDGAFLFADDAQVVELARVRKRYAGRGEEPHTLVELRAADMSAGLL